MAEQVIDDVIVETVTQHVGWAVWVGAEGDDPRFLAYFTSYDRAADYIAKCKAHDDEFYLCDPDIAPAVIDQEDGCIMTANDFDLVKGARALCRRFHIAVGDAERFEAEAREAMSPTASR